MRKRLLEELKRIESRRNGIKNRLEMIDNCQHEWVEVEIGEGETDFQCSKCSILKSELEGRD